MSTLRTALLALPFVEEKPDGTLDLWAVEPSGNSAADSDRGRTYFAWFLHVMREFDAAHMLLHVSVEWHGQPDPLRTVDVKTGWTSEMAASIRAASDDHPSLAIVSNRVFPSDLRDAALTLPFVSERADGTLNCFDVDYTGSFEESQARGRYYAALTAKFLRETDHPSFLTSLAMDADPTQRESALRIGFLSMLTEIAASSSPRATKFAKATYPMYEDAL